MAMRLALRCAGLTLTLAVVLPALGADYGGSGKKSTDKIDTKDPKEKLRSTGKLQGTLVTVDGNKKSFTLQVTLRVAVQNADALRNIVSLKQQLAQTTDVNSRRNIAVEIAKNQAKLYSIE